MVVNDLISTEQTTFIRGRKLLHSLMIMNEIISWYKSHHKIAMMFKEDFEKAWDSVQWDFLNDILDKMGFGTPTNKVIKTLELTNSWKTKPFIPNP